MKTTILAGAIALGLCFSAQAQTATGVGAAEAGALSNVNNYILNGNGGGGNGSGVGYINSTVSTNGVQWGFVPPSMGTTSYDACNRPITLSTPLGGFSIPLDKDICWSMRETREMATSSPPGSVQYARNCLSSSDWTTNDWETGTMACPRNKAKLAKTNPTDPRVHANQYVAVVLTGASAIPATMKGDPAALKEGMPRQAPPTGAPVAQPTYTSQAPVVIQAPPAPINSAPVQVATAPPASFADRRFP